MPRVDFDQLAEASPEMDLAATRTPQIDAFCSSSAWVLPARAAFSPRARPFAARERDTWVVMMRVQIRPGTWAAVPLEAGWGLAAPLLGPDPGRGAELLWRIIQRSEEPLQALFLSGLAPGGPHWTALVNRFGEGRSSTGLGECPRRAASLAGGYEGWLSRRGPRFRANLRRAQRRAASAGLRFERRDEGPAGPLFRRLLALEAGSWKGRAGEGINEGPPRDFYRRVVGRLVAQRALRVVIATLDGEDVAYVFGGVLAGTYRGLQVSFDERRGGLSPGNLVQAEMIRWLAEQGVETYDLGTDMPYKHRWGEEGLRTSSLVILP